MIPHRVVGTRWMKSRTHTLSSFKDKINAVTKKLQRQGIRIRGLLWNKEKGQKNIKKTNGKLRPNSACERC